MKLKHEEITSKILEAFFKHVYRRLGYGFLEKVYENALALELRQMGLKVVHQQPIPVYYGTDIVGEYYADLVVEDKVIVELKAARSLAEEHEAQLLNYLRATPTKSDYCSTSAPGPSSSARHSTTSARQQPGYLTTTSDNPICVFRVYPRPMVCEAIK